MTREAFNDALAESTTPAGLSPILTALWHVRSGNWAAAHAIAQQFEGLPASDRLHAHLHRAESDVGNARYWYRRANAPEAAGPLEREWDELVAANLT